MSVATVEPAAVGAPARVRRLPVPLCEPPFDDERDAGQAQTAGALVLPFDPPAPRRLRLLPASHDGGDVSAAERHTTRQLLPDPRTWGARLVQAVLEIVEGDRPLGQASRWVSTDVLDDLEALTHRRARDAAGSTRPGDARRRRERPSVRSVHVCEPVDGVAEVCAVVRRGPRCTALALRLEGLGGHWQCTALEAQA